MNALKILQEYWKYESFRPLQAEIIQSVLDGRDTLALMPTGGGKSICFQVPAMVRKGICVVITPLIALMKDQVEQLKSRGIEALAIFSGMSKREIDIALDNCVYGRIKFLYLSPERLASELVQERIRHMNINLFAVDEAHCISQWGYDFRPSYLNISVLRMLHPNVPYLALTATATPDVVIDIQEKLAFAQPNVLQKSFFRENLAYMALDEENKRGRMLRIIRNVGGSGIVYVRNRKETQEIARFLLHEGVSADFYHAGLETAIRMKKQDAWKSDSTRVIVATNAFGMGIDKPDVRFVIHLDLPDSLEAYYQEAGRAGRDGKKSYAVLLHHASDRVQLRKNFELSFPSIKFIQRVYQLLGNYYQIAYGAGAQLVLDFDIGDFCNKYDLNVVETLHALKFIERDGWVGVTENVYLPSRIKFETSVQELYRFQVKYANYDGLIKTILRSYGGAFDYYIQIREQDLAKRTGKSYFEVVDSLNQLQKLEILSYVPQTDSPQLTFLRPRVDTKHLHIDQHYLHERKAIKEEQLTSIFGYLDTRGCRSKYLLAYFAEDDTQKCGLCDNCIREKKRSDSGAEIEKELIQLLSSSPMTVHDLIPKLTLGDEEQRIKILRSLVDQGRIQTKEDLCFLL